MDVAEEDFKLLDGCWCCWKGCASEEADGVRDTREEQQRCGEVARVVGSVDHRYTVERVLDAEVAREEEQLRVDDLQVPDAHQPRRRALRHKRQRVLGTSDEARVGEGGGAKGERRTMKKTTKIQETIDGNNT